MTPTVTRIPSTAFPTLRRTWAAIVSVLAVVVATLSLSPAPASAAPQSVSGTVSFGTAGDHPAGVTAVVTWLKYQTSHYVPGPAEGVRTDDQGRYSLSLDPGTYKLRFTPSSADFQAVYWGGEASQFSSTVVVVKDWRRAGARGSASTVPAPAGASWTRSSAPATSTATAGTT